MMEQTHHLLVLTIHERHVFSFPVTVLSQPYPAEYYLTHVEPDHSLYRFYETPRNSAARETRGTRPADTVERTSSFGRIDSNTEVSTARTVSQIRRAALVAQRG